MIIGGSCNKIISLYTSSWQLRQVYELPGTSTQAKHIQFVPLPSDEREDSVSIKGT